MLGNCVYAADQPLFFGFHHQSLGEPFCALAEAFLWRVWVGEEDEG
jgi:hypothetical protein